MCWARRSPRTARVEIAQTQVVFVSLGYLLNFHAQASALVLIAGILNFGGVLLVRQSDDKGTG